METIIYISNTNIEVLSGERKRDAVSVSSYQHIPVATGSIINGVITDDTSIRQQLLVLKGNGLNECALIIDSTKILAKQIVIPKLKHDQILNYIKGELSQLYDGDDEVIYDYSYLGESETVKGATQIFAVGIEKSFIKSYIDLFEEVGIKLNSIDYAVDVLLRLKDYIPGLLDKSFAITNVDGNNLTSCVFNNGNYVLTSRNRILANDEETEVFTEQVTSAISALKQFASGAENATPFTDVYFTGLTRVKGEALFKSIQSQLNLKAELLPQMKNVYATKKTAEPLDLNSYLYTLGFLIGE